VSAELPRAHGAPVLRARYKAAPADFLVEEVPSFEPTGEGEHLLLTVEKTGMNTAFAARKLAAWAGIPEMGIGYAGLKDRNARTRQRFSVHLPKRVAPDLAALEADDFHVLHSAWHNRKLSRGALEGNRFVLALREASGDRDAVDARLQSIAAQGLPNYFGEQRFGREGDNVAAARRMFAGARVKREQRSIYLSAARSAIFNAGLARRIAEGDWNRGREGEVWMLDGTHSVFGPQPMDETLRARCGAQDIHPTGPLWGLGELRCAGACRALEREVAGQHEDLCAGLEAAGLKQERRALRVRVGALAWRWLAGDALELDFRLPPGAYATELLAELGPLDA
jgi:tRNA pseudouridine13 synthase